MNMSAVKRENTEDRLIIDYEDHVIKVLEEHSRKLGELETKMEEGNRVNSNGFNSVVLELKSLQTSLIAPATNENKVPLSTHSTVVKTLCYMLIILIVWFTGLQPHLSAILGVFK